MHWYYTSVVLCSIFLTFFYIVIWHKHFLTEFSVLFILVPISNLGYVFTANAVSLESVILSTKITYLGGCFMPLFVLLMVFSLCHVKLDRRIIGLAFVIAVVLFYSVLSIGYSPLFYKDVSLSVVNGINVIHKVYGPMHAIFYAYIILTFLASLICMVYAFFYKRDVSRKIIVLLFFPFLASFSSFFLSKAPFILVDLTPASYMFAQIVYLIIIHRVCLYDITDTGVDSLVQTGDTGFISFDFNFNYLGSNETARHMMTELCDIRIDSPAQKNQFLRETVIPWIVTFKNNETDDKFHYTRGDRIYLVDVNYLFNGTHKRGYQLFITDDTQDQKYISLLNEFNTSLQKEVEEKTAHILEMHNQLILGMATMVESRDNSTGGHIMRTSELVSILTEEILKENRLNLSGKFCSDLVKAAPMHDLGKIAIDDKILRKPGKFTDDEYSVMKTHAAEGAKIVHHILRNTDDESFKLIAENVAHYHHERWDGSGYPDGLVGNDIPLEARIMAIADVYDALVSKRVYKESMSFESADKIIMEGMGKHFDKALEPYYRNSREKFEAYYTQLGSE